MLAWVLWLLAAPPEQLLKDGAPVEMTAKGGLRVDLKRNRGFAKGDVVITREDITVCCDEAEAEYAKNRIEVVTCKGRVVVVRPDGTRATANVAVFRAAQDQVTLSGAAQVVSKEAQLAGERIIYNIGEDRLEVEGSKARFRFDPKTVAPVVGRECPPKP